LHEGASDGNGLNTIVKESKKNSLLLLLLLFTITARLNPHKNINPKKKKNPTTTKILFT
jgi:hypothetical protein